MKLTIFFINHQTGSLYSEAYVHEADFDNLTSMPRQSQKHFAINALNYTFI